MKKWIIFTFALIIPLSVVSSVKAYEPVTGTVTSNVPWTKLVKPKANALLNGVITIELVKNENTEVIINRIGEG